MDFENKVNQLEKENNQLKEKVDQLESTIDNMNKLIEEYNTFTKEEIDAYSDFVDDIITRDFIDPSTRVYSRKFFDKIFYLLLEKAFESQKNYGLIILKLPELAEIKYEGELYKGPEMEIGKILRSNVRLPLDLVLRYSKTTFAIIIPDITEDVLFKVSDRIKSQIEKLDFINNLEIYKFYLPQDLTSTGDLIKYFE
ncbi:hypothetical protein XO10_00185 [Marinitoga sp. 1135]|uniref:GGDEF domain-containing protein n=1 Tax=Marinitoga piezophila (strain DSM 14283 / JCM 11233 / KA3) TaxID=443254 RepID=H2J2Q3_MARPK|nr:MULTISPECIES: diguanylate cyclase [Marinitoga]AEX84497.1 GGDEF domain-containing protein [Marinitoga piezophila KA3]NUU94748.1 hypothetical protein [Marinitoga sp. 1135]NUU96677.1 hypothetical protein [Marinitoga sp. 1138]